MASNSQVNIKVKLALFLLAMAALVATLLYIELLSKNKLLLERVEQLEQSQVLLMVPDEQAQAIATWLAQNPEQTQSILEQAHLGEQVSIPMGPGANTSSQTRIEQHEVPPLLQNVEEEAQGARTKEELSPDSQSTKRDTAPKLAPKVVAEGKDGVKVIKLPHGGIRVTTREDK